MANGGVIGPPNNTSFGKNTVTSKTSSGDITTQAGTRLINTVVVAGGGGGARICAGGGGGAGGVIQANSLSVSGSTAYTATVGGGGAGGPTYDLSLIHI